MVETRLVINLLSGLTSNENIIPNPIAIGALIAINTKIRKIERYK